MVFPIQKGHFQLPDVIAEMNKEVEEATRSVAGGKRGHYQTYTSSERSQIGKYASQHGATAASRHFSHKLKKSVSRSTAKSMKKAYEEELRKRRRCDDESDQEISDLPAKKRGRKVLLGEDLDMKVQLYLRKVREGGGAIFCQDSYGSCMRNLVQVQPINAG